MPTHRPCMRVLPWPTARNQRMSYQERYLFFLALALTLFLFFFFVFFLAFGQPRSAIFVLCLITAPFWPVIVVGISSLAAALQRLYLALAGRLTVSAECGPSGRLSSKLVIGTSGTLAKVLLVMPLAMWTLPVRSTRTPSPCRISTTSGKAAPPCETRYTGPLSVPGSTGVLDLAIPISEPAGQVAGLASKVAAGQACWMVVSRAGSCWGSVTATDLTLACPGL